MGLFKFLKEKFGKKKDNEEKVEEQVASFEPEEKPEEVVLESTPAVEEVKEETKVEEAIPVVEEPKEELKVEEEPAPVIQRQMAEEKPAPVVEQPKVEVKKEEPKEPKIEKKPEVREEKKETKTYIKGMEKSRENFANKIEKLSKKYKKVNQEYFEQLEEILIEADVGVNLTLSVIDQVINESKAKKIDDADSINELVIDTLFEDYAKSGVDVQNDVRFQDEGTTVLLVAGVNGVGKTTTAINLAASLAVLENKVLIIDADPQANTTSGLNFSPDNDQKRTLYEVMIGELSIEDALIQTELANLHMIPSHINLVGVEIEMLDAEERESILKKALKTIKDRYDYIIIDCSPSLGLITVNALTAADSVIIPVQPEFFALEGLGKLLRRVVAVGSGDRVVEVTERHPPPEDGKGLRGAFRNRQAPHQDKESRQDEADRTESVHQHEVLPVGGQRSHEDILLAGVR